MSSSERIKELKIDSTLWADPKRIINLLDFDPKKLSIYTQLNSISNTPDASSKDLIEVYEVRYDNGGFYLVIDDIKGYFNIDDDVGSILNLILTDDQKNKYHQVWKEIFKKVNDGNGELILHEKIRLIDSNFPIEKIFKIHSITIVIKSLIEKDNKFYLELALNRCLFEPYEIKLNKMLEYDKINISEGIDINKCEETSRECSLCKFYYFLDKNLKYGPYLCDSCYDMFMKTVITQNLTIINHNGNYYRVIFAFISKKDAYNLIKNAVILGEKGTL